MSGDYQDSVQLRYGSIEVYLSGDDRPVASVGHIQFDQGDRTPVMEFYPDDLPRVLAMLDAFSAKIRDRLEWEDRHA